MSAAPEQAWPAPEVHGAAAIRRWVSDPLPGSGDAAAAWAAQTLLEAGLGPDLDGVAAVEALHLATSDGGAREALAFWAAARRTGLSVAAPAAFPWTLSTSVTGRISQALQITGACTTYVGGDEALSEALIGAGDDVSDGLARSALVVSLRGLDPIGPEGGPTRLELVAVLLGR